MQDLLIKIRTDNKWHWKMIMIGLFALIILIVASSVITSKCLDKRIQVFYSLDARHNDKELINVIDNADHYIYFAIYYFTKTSIADALVRAKKRGVDVVGIMDRDSSMNSNARILQELQFAGIKVLTQKHPEGIMHIKVLVTESAYASGSYNWTDGATNVNDEVLEIGTNESVRKQYLAIIKKILTINQ